MKAFALVTLLVAASPHSLAQSSNCNNTYKSFLSHPGYQPDAEINTPCAQTSVTVTVTVSLGGEIKIVEAGTSGSISVTIETPSSCPSQKLWIEEDLHSCGLPLEGYGASYSTRSVLGLFAPIRLAAEAPRQALLTHVAWTAVA